MTLPMLQDFFFWCSVINMGALLFSFTVFWIFRDGITKLHKSIFNTSEEKIHSHMYLMYGHYKILVFVFNVIPFIALKIIG